MEERLEQLVFCVSPEVKKRLEEVWKEKYVGMSEEEVLEGLLELGLQLWKKNPEMCEKLLR